MSPRRVLLIVIALFAAIIVSIAYSYRHAAVPIAASRTPTKQRQDLHPLQLISGWSYAAPESTETYWVYLKGNQRIVVTISQWSVREVAQGTHGWTAQEQHPGYICGHAPIEEVWKCAFDIRDGSIIVTGITGDVALDAVSQFTQGYFVNS